MDQRGWTTGAGAHTVEDHEQCPVGQRGGASAFCSSGWQFRFLFGSGQNRFGRLLGLRSQRLMPSSSCSPRRCGAVNRDGTSCRNNLCGFVDWVPLTAASLAEAEFDGARWPLSKDARSVVPGSGYWSRHCGCGSRRVVSSRRLGTGSGGCLSERANENLIISCRSSGDG